MNTEPESESAQNQGDASRNRRPGRSWVFAAPAITLAAYAATLAIRDNKERTPVDITGVPKHDLRPLTLKASDAETGLGLHLSGSPQAVTGWRVGSIAKWRTNAPPARYRVTLEYLHRLTLGTRPVKVTVRAGCQSTSAYLPVSSNEKNHFRYAVGEIEVTSAEEYLDCELTEGPGDETWLMLHSVTLEPLNPVR